MLFCVKCINLSVDIKYFLEMHLSIEPFTLLFPSLSFISCCFVLIRWYLGGKRRETDESNCEKKNCSKQYNLNNKFKKYEFNLLLFYTVNLQQHIQFDPNLHEGAPWIKTPKIIYLTLRRTSRRTRSAKENQEGFFMPCFCDDDDEGCSQNTKLTLLKLHIV